MRKLLLASLIVAGLPLLTVRGAGADGTGASTRGNYTRSSAIAGTCRRGALGVTTTASGTNGTFSEAAYSCSSGVFTGDSFSATATCLAVTGHTAVISGHIDHGTGIFAGFSSIQEIVDDNSTPNSSLNPDRAVNQAFDGAPTCAPRDALADRLPVTLGEIIVVAAT